MNEMNVMKWMNPAMSRSSSDKSKTISDKMYEGAFKSAGSETVSQRSNMTEWLAFRRCLDVQEDRHAGWEDIFQTVLASATICATGNLADDVELAAGLMQ